MRITMGQVEGGPEVEDTALSQAIDEAGKILQEIGGDSGQEGRLNAMYYLPGSIWETVSFSGLRYAVFDKTNITQQIQIAAPVSYPDWDERTAREFVIATLKQAAELAADRFSRRSIKIDDKRANASIESISGQWNR